MKKNILAFITAHLWLFCLLAGLAGTLCIWLLLPLNRETVSLPVYLLCILVFIFVLLGISFFPNNFKAGYLLLLLIFVFHLGYLSPRMNYFAQFRQIDNYYLYENILLNPLLFFAVCFAFRLGGGKSESCFKTGLSAVILLFSGLVDLMWFLVNKVNYTTHNVSIPHIKVIIGHHPTLSELLLFIAVHLLLLVFINILPLGKYFHKIQIKRELS